ncbi:MAG: TetR/AcrR family transcriptional regulator [Methylobacteriaceae bacterium]|nr:TetR/AcrR family transcriptional regulator [Methylobacteriaceae bacterium]
MSREKDDRPRKNRGEFVAEGGPRTRRRRAEILDAAAHVFASKGFHGATTQDIADVLGIRQASLYYYFSSKEEALEAVCLMGAEGFYEQAKEVMSGDGDARSKVAALVASHLAPLATKPDYIKAFLHQRQFLPGASRRKIGRWSRGLERLFERAISGGIATGEFRAGLDARVATLGILGMLNGVPAWIGKEGRDLSSIVEQISDLAIGCLEAKDRL